MTQTLDGMERAVTQHALFVEMECDLPSTPTPKTPVPVNDDPNNRKYKRKDGEGAWKCLWCMKWRCDGPLQKCRACAAEYRRMAIGMPKLANEPRPEGETRGKRNNARIAEAPCGSEEGTPEAATDPAQGTGP